MVVHGERQYYKCDYCATRHRLGKPVLFENVAAGIQLRFCSKRCRDDWLSIDTSSRKCEACGRMFKNEHGLRTHVPYCKEDPKTMHGTLKGAILEIITREQPISGTAIEKVLKRPHSTTHDVLSYLLENEYVERIPGPPTGKPGRPRKLYCLSGEGGDVAW